MKFKLDIKMKKLIIIYILFLSIAGCEVVTDTNPVNNIKSDLDILRLYVSDEELLNIFNNRFTDLEIAGMLEYKSESTKILLEASGAGSRYFPKYSFRVTPQKFLIRNLPVFTVSAQVYDKTMMKGVIAKYLYEAVGFPVFFNMPVFITINNKNHGLYSLIERINADFFHKKNIPVYELYQVSFDSKFTFGEKNNVKENFDKEIPDNDNYENLEAMISAIDEADPNKIFEDLSPYLDIENYLWYHAVSSVRHDPDAFTNNFFLYKESGSAPFKVLPWDFDKTFDVVGSVGFYGDNAIIRKLFESDTCRILYNNYMEFILANVFTEEKLFPIIDSLYTPINDYYKYDPFFSNTTLESEVEKMKAFIIKRREEMLAELNK